MKLIILFCIIISTTSLLGYEIKYHRTEEWSIEGAEAIENVISKQLQKIQKQLLEAKHDSTVLSIIDYYDKRAKLEKINIVLENIDGIDWITGIHFVYKYKKDYSGVEFEFKKHILCNREFRRKTAKEKIQYISSEIGSKFIYEDNSMLSTLEKAGDPVPIPDAEITE